MKKIKEILIKIKDWKYLSLLILVLIIVLIYSFGHFYKRDDCSTIAIIPITDFIYTSPQYNEDGSINKGATVSIDVIDKIRKAEKEKSVKAVVFLIDSAGGYIQSGEEIVDAIREMKKPSVSLIRSQGQSSAYWVASATGHIFASKTSDTGAIGVTMSYLDNTKQNEANGLTFNQISYGKYKDMSNSDKPLTADEKKILLEQITEEAKYFMEDVANNRNLPIEKVEALDSSVIQGSKALEIGLIDEIGSFADVERYLSEMLKRNVSMCILSNEIDKETLKKETYQSKLDYIKYSADKEKFPKVMALPPEKAVELIDKMSKGYPDLWMESMLVILERDLSSKE